MFDIKHVRLTTDCIHLSENGDFKVGDWGLYIAPAEFRRYFGD
jgi:hypothetical protein